MRTIRTIQLSKEESDRLTKMTAASKNAAEPSIFRTVPLDDGRKIVLSVENGQIVCSLNESEDADSSLPANFVLQDEGGNEYEIYLTDETETANAYVHQKPVDVSFDCPYCGKSCSFDYDNFTADHGDPPDWNDEKIQCPHCGGAFRIGGQEWD